MNDSIIDDNKFDVNNSVCDEIDDNGNKFDVHNFVCDDNKDDVERNGVNKLICDGCDEDTNVKDGKFIYLLLWIISFRYPLFFIFNYDVYIV